MIVNKLSNAYVTCSLTTYILVYILVFMYTVAYEFNNYNKCCNDTVRVLIIFIIL